MIPVTKTFVPPIEEYTRILSRAFDKGWLTNRGELVLELENELKALLRTPHFFILNNGTIPLQIALKLLGNRGEIITTPFSYVATTASIIWEQCTPVFVDIEPDSLTIDASKIEEAITPETTCILATHVFGNPCDIEEIERIALKHNLSVIYDAAHCFGVTYKGKSIFHFGTISTCSFHATKIFHTGEGGALFCNNEELLAKAFYSHNFGHDGPLAFHGLGINGKISELQAAMGLAVLPYFPQILDERKKLVEAYQTHLQHPDIEFLKLREGTEWNYSYFPVILPSESDLLQVMELLAKKEIHPRRYFYPSLDRLPFVNSVQMPVSNSVSGRIMCLPLFTGLEMDAVTEICRIITNYVNTRS